MWCQSQRLLSFLSPCKELFSNLQTWILSGHWTKKTGTAGLSPTQRLNCALVHGVASSVYAAENLSRMHDDEGQGLLFDCPLCKVAIVVGFYPRLHLHLDDALLSLYLLLNICLFQLRFVWLFTKLHLEIILRCSSAQNGPLFASCCWCNNCRMLYCKGLRFAEHGTLITLKMTLTLEHTNNRYERANIWETDWLNNLTKV